MTKNILETLSYPQLIELEGRLTKLQILELDKNIKASFDNDENSIINLNFEDSSIVEFLQEKQIINTFYIFKCLCGEDDCYKEEFSESQFTDLKSYWKRYEEGKTDEQEDKEMNCGSFEVGCWKSNPDTMYIYDLKTFIEHLTKTVYIVVCKPEK